MANKVGQPSLVLITIVFKGVRCTKDLVNKYTNTQTHKHTNFSTVKLDKTMNTYKNDKNINKERDNIDVNVQKLQVFGQRSKTPPSCTLTADRSWDQNL